MKSDGVKYRAGDVPEIKSNFDDLEIVNGTTWNENIVCTRDVKYENGTLVLLLQQPYGAIAQTPGWNCAFNCGGQHTIYNAFSFVDSPGEFYFDKTAKMLYYYPYDWEDMTTADVEAPFADQLITIAGESTGNRVKNLTFSGITFAHTDYQLTDVAGSHGKTTCQAAAFDVQYGVDIENLQEGGRDVGYIENGDWIGFKNVDFKDGADAIEFCYASPSGGSSIEVRLGAPDGTLIGSCEMKNTGGWHDFATNTAAIEKTTGRHDLYFVFNGAGKDLFTFYWWRMK